MNIPGVQNEKMMSRNLSIIQASCAPLHRETSNVFVTITCVCSLQCGHPWWQDK